MSGLAEFNDAMDAMMAAVVAATEKALAQGAHMIEASAKQHSSGRPGPNVGTGALRQSIHVEGPEETAEDAYTASIGASMVYSRRLELGFTGTDAAGRHYGPPKNPAKYPYMEPALAEVEPKLQAVFEEAWASALGQ